MAGNKVGVIYLLLLSSKLLLLKNCCHLDLYSLSVCVACAFFFPHIIIFLYLKNLMSIYSPIYRCKFLHAKN